MSQPIEDTFLKYKKKFKGREAEIKEFLLKNYGKVFKMQGVTGVERVDATERIKKAGFVENLSSWRNSYKNIIISSCNVINGVQKRYDYKFIFTKERLRENVLETIEDALEKSLKLKLNFKFEEAIAKIDEMLPIVIKKKDKYFEKVLNDTKKEILDAQQKHEKGMEQIQKFEDKIKIDRKYDDFKSVINNCEKLIKTATSISRKDLVRKYKGLIEEIKKEIEDRKAREEALSQAEKDALLKKREEEKQKALDEKKAQEAKRAVEKAVIIEEKMIQEAQKTINKVIKKKTKKELKQKNVQKTKEIEAEKKNLKEEKVRAIIEKKEALKKEKVVEKQKKAREARERKKALKDGNLRKKQEAIAAKQVLKDKKEEEKLKAVEAKKIFKEEIALKANLKDIEIDALIENRDDEKIRAMFRDALLAELDEPRTLTYNMIGIMTQKDRDFFVNKLYDHVYLRMIRLLPVEQRYKAEKDLLEQYTLFENESIIKRFSGRITLEKADIVGHIYLTNSRIIAHGKVDQRPKTKGYLVGQGLREEDNPIDTAAKSNGLNKKGKKKNKIKLPKSKKKKYNDLIVAPNLQTVMIEVSQNYKYCYGFQSPIKNAYKIKRTKKKIKYCTSIEYNAIFGVDLLEFKYKIAPKRKKTEHKEEFKKLRENILDITEKTLKNSALLKEEIKENKKKLKKAKKVRKKAIKSFKKEEKNKEKVEKKKAKKDLKVKKKLLKEEIKSLKTESKAEEKREKNDLKEKKEKEKSLLKVIIKEKKEEKIHIKEEIESQTKKIKEEYKKIKTEETRKTKINTIKNEKNDKIRAIKAEAKEKENIGEVKSKDKIRAIKIEAKENIGEIKIKHKNSLKKIKKTKKKDKEERKIKLQANKKRFKVLISKEKALYKEMKKEKKGLKKKIKKKKKQEKKKYKAKMKKFNNLKSERKKEKKANQNKRDEIKEAKLKDLKQRNETWLLERELKFKKQIKRYKDYLKNLKKNKTNKTKTGKKTETEKIKKDKFLTKLDSRRFVKEN